MTKRKTPMWVKVARTICLAIPSLLVVGALAITVAMSPLFYWLTGYEIVDLGEPE